MPDIFVILMEHRDSPSCLWHCLVMQIMETDKIYQLALHDTFLFKL